VDFAEFCTQFDGTDIGVTGTRWSASAEQYNSLAFAIENLHEHGANRLHHGGAIGVDSEAHWRACRLASSGMTVTIHPPIKKRYAAKIDFVGRMDSYGLKIWPGCEVLPDKAFGARDYDIVLASGVLLAVPQLPHDHPLSAHSGTWLTVGFALKEGVPVYVIDRQSGAIELFTGPLPTR
jgi:hypothetical protein